MVNETKTISSRMFDIFNVVFFVIMSFLFAYPLYTVLVNSFSTPDAVLVSGFKFFPPVFSISAYKRVFQSPMIWISYGNTIFLVAMTWIFGITLTIMGAYPLSRRDLPNRKFWTLFIVFNMFFSGGLIPSYLLVRQLGWMNSYLALVVPSIVNTWNMILARNYFMALPQEIFDAASIDGASESKILWNIVVPLSKPIIATLSLFIIVSNWNSWFDCLLYITETKKMVLQVILRRIITADSKEIITASADSATNGQVNYDRETIKAATIMIATAPILTIYPFIQKYFVKGIMVGSLKG